MCEQRQKRRRTAGFRKLQWSPAEFGATLVVGRFDLQRGMGDPVTAAQQFPGLIQDTVAVSEVLGHQMHGRDMHPRGQRPQV